MTTAPTTARTTPIARRESAGRPETAGVSASDRLWAARLWALLVALRPPDGWLSAGLLAFNMIVVVWSVEVADWAPTPPLVLVMLLSLLTALLLCRIPLWTALLLPLGMLAGIGIIIWLMVAAAPDALQIATAADLFQRLGLWLSAARNEGISVDPLPFAVGLMLASWVSGYLAGWAFFRYRNFWGVFALGTAGLLSNLTFLPDNASIYLGIYLFSGLLLVGCVQSVRARQRWDRVGRIYDGHLGILTMSDTAVVALVALVIAFLLPIGGQWGPANAIYNTTRSPLVSWEEDFNRLFAGLPARRPLPYRIWGDALAFQGTINPTDTPVLQVNSPVPMYWKARSYATYTHEGWISEGTTLKEPGWQPEYSAPSPYRERFNVTFEVIPNYDSRSVFAGGQVIGANRDVRIETFDSPRYVIDPRAASPADRLPPALAQAVDGIRTAVAQDAAAAAPDIAAGLPTAFLLESVERDETGAVTRAVVAETVPAQPDVLSVRTARGNAASGSPYQVTTAVSSAQPDDLRTAGDEYPPWVWARYTELPPDLPERVAVLARNITAGAATPYDRAKAIEQYLKNNYAYNLEIEPPPFGADGVDYFLFDSREGYSEYFGSAMTVLARSVGIPARMATGYTAGNPIDGSQVYLVADHHSHGWSEVYFNGFGWIPFEPTPGRAIPIALPPEAAPRPDAGDVSGDATGQLPCDFEEDCEELEDLIDANESIPPEGIAATWAQRAQSALPWLAGGAAAVLIILIAALTAWRALLATPRDVPTAYRRLRRLSGPASLAPRQHQTPHQWGAAISAALPEQRAAIFTIVDAYARHAYAAHRPAPPSQTATIAQAWAALRTPLLLHALRRRET